MRNLKDLLKNNETVWIFIGDDDELKARFMKQVKDEEFTFGEETSIDTYKCGNAMAIHNDMSIRYVPLHIWSMSRNVDGYKDIPRVCYEEYVDGGEEYWRDPVVYEGSGNVR